MRTDRLLIRGIIDSDLENIFKGLSNPEVVKYYGVSYSSLEATKEQMIWYANEKQMWWAICSLDNMNFYGAGGLNDIDSEAKKAEVGLWLLPEYWGNGIMKEVLPLICDYGFERLGLNRIEGFVESENQNCKKVMANLDFRHEGTMKDYEVKGGRHISIDVYANLKDQEK